MTKSLWNWPAICDAPAARRGRPYASGCGHLVLLASTRVLAYFLLNWITRCGCALLPSEVKKECTLQSANQAVLAQLVVRLAQPLAVESRLHLVAVCTGAEWRDTGAESSQRQRLRATSYFLFEGSNLGQRSPPPQQLESFAQMAAASSNSGLKPSSALFHSSPFGSIRFVLA